MKIFFLKSFILSLAFALNTGMYAQVTIGSNINPLNGALLDLKQTSTTDGSANSSKGVGMPRVTLTNLKPTTPAQLSASIGSTGDWDLAAHTALLVYNITENLCATTPIYKGLYVFTGTEWELIENLQTPVQYLQDPRNQLLGAQTYPYRTFGVAGTWMLENMRYVPNDGGATMIERLGDPTNNSLKCYAYPNEVTIGTVPASWRSPQGLLYSYSAATLGAQDAVTVNQGQNLPTEGPMIPIQGICPTGWHIPSDREWNMLEQELYNNGDKYSSYTTAQRNDVQNFNPTAWNAAWNTEDWDRGSAGDGGHGLVMLSPCQLPNTTINTGGKSLIVAQGGFNALLVGYAEEDTRKFYGQFNYFWASSTAGGTNAWYRSMGYEEKTVYRLANERRTLQSVRCKKDEDISYVINNE